MIRVGPLKMYLEYFEVNLEGKMWKKFKLINSWKNWQMDKLEKQEVTRWDWSESTQPEIKSNHNLKNKQINIANNFDAVPIDLQVVRWKQNIWPKKVGSCSLSHSKLPCKPCMMSQNAGYKNSPKRTHHDTSHKHMIQKQQQVWDRENNNKKAEHSEKNMDE